MFSKGGAVNTKVIALAVERLSSKILGQKHPPQKGKVVIFQPSIDFLLGGYSILLNVRVVL